MVWPLTLFGAAAMVLFGYAFYLFHWDDREPFLAWIYATCFALAAAAFVSSFLIG